MTALRDGVDLHAGHPVLALRNRLVRDRPVGLIYEQEGRVLLTFLAWRAYLKRERITKLQLPTRVDDDTFRRVLGLP